MALRHGYCAETFKQHSYIVLAVHYEPILQEHFSIY